MRTFAPMVGLSLFFASTLAAATPNQRNEQPGGKKPLKGFQDPHLGPWGELLQAHVWAQALFETDVRTCKWQPSEMSGLNPKMAAKLREIAYEAVEKPVGR